jgi:hypothetical protein
MTPDEEQRRRERNRGRPVPGPAGWEGGDWRTAREQWRRRRMQEAGRDGAYGPPWRRHRGFGCVFGLLFLFVIGSLVAAMAIVVSQLGPVPGLVALALVVAVLAGMGRTLFITARTLDQLVDATRKVKAGD